MLTATQGTFQATEREGFIVTGAGTGELTIVGRASAMDDYLAHEVVHAQAAHSNLLEVRINDNGSAGAAHQWKVFQSELARALPGGGVWGAIVDLSIGTNVWSRQDFERSARQRIELLDAPTAEQRPVDDAAETAKQRGLADVWFFDYRMIDYGVNANDIQVVKAVVAYHVKNFVSDAAQIAFYDPEVKVTGNDNLDSPLPIRLSAAGIDPSNKTGHLVTYVIAPPESIQTVGTHVTVWTAVPEIDVSGSSPDSENHFIVRNAKVLIRGGEGTDVYFLMQALETVFDSQGTRVAGYIVDNAGTNVVSFGYAPSTDAQGRGHEIHSGLGYSGERYYEGIRAYEGSMFNDLFTRYEGRSDVEMVYRGGGGDDTFDLRSGNNVVHLGSGVVHFDLSGRPVGVTNAPSFDNSFTELNTNWVDLSNTEGAEWFEVHGSDKATDVVTFSSRNGPGLSYTRQLLPTIVDGHEVPFGAYVVSDLLDSSKIHGFISRHVDQIHGSSQADVIEVDRASTLKQFVGHGGADRVTVDSADFTVIQDKGASVTTLKSGAYNATVEAASGNRVNIETVDAAAADDVVTVYMKGTAWEPPVVIDAYEATTHLRVSADTGIGQVFGSMGDTTIVIKAGAQSVQIDDNDARLGALKIQFMDVEGEPFDVTKLYSYDAQGREVQGFSSQPSNDRTTYNAMWRTEEGHEIQIIINSDDGDLSDLLIGQYSVAGTGLTPLDQWVAQAQPLPVPA